MRNIQEHAWGLCPVQSTSEAEAELAPDAVAAVDPKTVFVKNLSYELVCEDVEKAFSEIGPVRKCFLLQGKGHHKVPMVAQVAKCPLHTFK